jgi:hypothetical protein
MKKILSIIASCLILLVAELFIVFYHPQDVQVEKLERQIVLDNGLTFDIKPSYKDRQLRINLNVSKGWAHLNDGENYFIHLVDSDGFDITGIKFYERDFSWDADNVHRAYKRITIDKNKLKNGVKFKMLYPIWVEDE